MSSSLNTSKFKQLYEHYRYLMLNIAYKVLGNKGLAEEVVQDSLLKMLINIDNIGDVACRETKGWVVLVTKRTALNKLKYERMRGHESGDVFALTPDAAESVENAVIHNLKVRQVLDELKAIDDKYSELLILRYYYGYTDSKLALHFGVSAETVRKRCERGKKVLLANLMVKKGETHEEA